MGYIPQAALENLKKYTYSGVDKSIVSKYLLGPFWNWFVTLWPKTVAPNTVRVSSLCVKMGSEGDVDNAFWTNDCFCQLFHHVVL